MVTDFVYFLLFKHGYYKSGKSSLIFQNLCDIKVLFFVHHKRFKSCENLTKSMTLQKPLKKSVIPAVSGVASSICLEITIVLLKFVLYELSKKIYCFPT